MSRYIAALDIDHAAAQAAVRTRPAASDAIALACDVGDSAAMQAAVAETVGAFGGLNVLCPVAGGSTPRDASVTEAPEDEFWRAIRLDIFGTFLCCKHGLPELIRAGGDR